MKAKKVIGLLVLTILILASGTFSTKVLAADSSYILGITNIRESRRSIWYWFKS